MSFNGEHLCKLGKFFRVRAFTGHLHETAGLQVNTGDVLDEKLSPNIAIHFLLGPVVDRSHAGCQLIILPVTKKKIMNSSIDI
jgi:hypothetical protein